jgi:PKD repeat protein
MKKISILVFALLFAGGIKAQNWKSHMSDASRNFYDTQKEFYKEYAKKEKESRKERNTEGKTKAEKAEMEQELPGYELFKRWENYMAPRVYPSGDIRQVTRAQEEYQTYLRQQSSKKGQPASVLSSTWQAVGPFGDPAGGNAGRINAVRIDPSNPSSLWIATPDGGLWNTTNLGVNWSTQTDQIAVLGSSDMVFEPGNPQTMYLATGDGDAGDSYSIGVLKSIDGGSTWNPSGLSWPISLRTKMYKLLINPLNKNVLFAATTKGLYRTLDAGTTWNVVGVAGAKITDVEYRPGDTTTLYAVSSDFYKSTDGGATFSIVTSALPLNTAVDRLAIAVTPADPAVVYVVGSDATNDGFYGFYQSTDKGSTFAKKASSPNLLGWASNGNDSGGQGWYTLSIAASPTNASEVVVGGVNIWRTTTAGNSWNLFAHWTGQGAPYVHADIHDLTYLNGTTLFTGTDGGVFTTTNSGTSFAAINGNMNIAEIYHIGLSKNTYQKAISGHQDNGTNIFNGGWSQTLGGDGMDCFMDWSNDKVMYGEQYQGSFNVTTDGGVNWNGITNGLTGTGAWVTPWHQDPITPNTIYGGYQQMFKSANQGTSWTQMGTLPGTGFVVEFAIAPSNPQVIYVIKSDTIFKSTNGGIGWTDITGTLPTANAQMTAVTVEDRNPNRVWVTFSGYSNGNKVYASADGGLTWANYSTGLPNLPTNTIVYWNGTKDGLYVGCDVGIYYRDSTMASWMAYNAGLPNVSVFNLQIFYPLGKISAATFGRGIWEADLYNNGTLAPLANFTTDKNIVCPAMSVHFTDKSTFTPTAWSWTFPGGSPGSSLLQNPVIVYNLPGTYSVTLSCSNANGSNSMTKTLFITVSSILNVPLSEGFEVSTFPPLNWQNYDAGSDGFAWARNTSTGKGSSASVFYDNYNNNAGGTRDEMHSPKYDLSGITQGKLYFDVAFAQYSPAYSDSLAVLISTDCGLSYSQVYLKGGTALATAPDKTNGRFTPTAAQWRTDTISLAAFSGMSDVMVTFQNRGYNGQAIYLDNINLTDGVSHLGIETLADETELFIYPNPFAGKLSLEFGPSSDATSIQLFEYNGKLVRSEKVNGSKMEMDLSALNPGLYIVQVTTGKGRFSRKVEKL